MKFLKYSVIAFSLFLVVAVGFFCYSIYKLPDPVAIKEKLKNEPQIQKPQTEIQKEILAEAQAIEDSVAQKNPETGSQETQKSRSNMKFEDLIEEDYQDIRICENLGNSTQTDFSLQTLTKAIESTDRDDPIVESIRFPMKHVFQSKPVKELFAEIKDIDANNLEGEERTSYLKKINFYTKAAKKVGEIYNQKAEYEEVSDRAYHLHVIAQIAQKKPELAHDKNLTDFCNQLETSVATKSKTSIDEERKELLKLIEYAGLTPEELDFNPTIRTKFNIDLNKNGLSFGFHYPGMKIQ